MRTTPEGVWFCGYDFPRDAVGGEEFADGVLERQEGHYVPADFDALSGLHEDLVEPT